jgi:hypothetical protein
MYRACPRISASTMLLSNVLRTEFHPYTRGISLPTPYAQKNTQEKGKQAIPEEEIEYGPQANQDARNQ